MKKYMFSAAVIALLGGLPLLLLSGNGGSDVSAAVVADAPASHCCWSAAEAEAEADLVASHCCWSADGEVDLRM